MDGQVFRIPTSRAKTSAVAFRPIKAVPQDQFFAELERPLQLLDLLLGAALVPRQVQHFVFKIQDAPIQFDVIELLNEFGKLSNIFYSSHFWPPLLAKCYHARCQSQLTLRRLGTPRETGGETPGTDRRPVAAP